MTEQRTIHTGGGDYRETHVTEGAQYAEGDIVNLSGEERRSLAEAAAEIQALLEQLGKSYAIATPEGQAAATAAVVEKIAGDRSLKRLLRAARMGGLAAIEKLLDHPLAAGVVAAIQDLQETE